MTYQDKILKDLADLHRPQMTNRNQMICIQCDPRHGDPCPTMLLLQAKKPAPVVLATPSLVEQPNLL